MTPSLKKYRLWYDIVKGGRDIVKDGCDIVKKGRDTVKDGCDMVKTSRDIVKTYFKLVFDVFCKARDIPESGISRNITVLMKDVYV